MTFLKRKKMEEQTKNYREPGLFDEMAREGNRQEEPEISYGTRKQGNYQRLLGFCKKDIKANRKDFPLTKTRQFGYQK